MENTTQQAEVIPCATFSEFTARVRPRRFMMERAFRGQQNVSWKLQSLWERYLSRAFHDENSRDFDILFGSREKRIYFQNGPLEHFRRQAEGLSNVPEEVIKNDLHLWALGRHHGLVTPLLDWTQSPYIAAFFAFFDRLKVSNDGFIYGPGMGPAAGTWISSEPVAIWELCYDETLSVKEEFEIFISRYADAGRQKAQSALFTILTHQSIADLESYLIDRKLIHLLRCYKIPGTRCGEALGSLRQMNITYGTLFPDLDGAAIEANTLPLMRSLELMQ